ncbi:VOC family protein [Streptomyces johnsoniae]|uniref:VOC family protein n=1 Tax=Streptomyces johnsoniae TaxID=3075532 RepID=A0ABU2S6S3_9ACTN|nr:VOC family protein [Streptomyces sp. DSM 41886]MDT0444671.1 VOC family protein [Streptomyces sp. DSM 41886]
MSDLASPIYPPETPAHIAYYLAVDDVDRRAEAATANGARLVVPPFDAGDQGRLATLIDPVGAAFSLWQPHRFAGWSLPPHLAGTPQRMVLASDQPDRARHFYRATTGADLARAEFVTAGSFPPSTRQWEVVIGVDDPDHVVARARDHGADVVTWSEKTGRPVVRLSGPERLTCHVRRLES